MTKTYKQLQDDAELLGIKQNQSTEKLIEAINEATSPKAVFELLKSRAELIVATDELQDMNAGLTKRLDEVGQGGTVTPAGELESIIVKIGELHDAQIADKAVHTEPYRTGLANGILIARAVITGEEVTDKLLKPITQVDIGGAKIPTQRERLVKAAGKYITLAGKEGPQLRTNLSEEDIAKADEIMVALGGKKGVYVLPSK